MGGLGATVQQLASSIAQQEGFSVAGSVAARDNNPGDLMFAGQTGATGADAAGFAVFPSSAAGWQALDNQITLDSSRGLTLAQFISKYAPPTANNTSAYLSAVSASTGIDPSAVLSAALAGDPASPYVDSSLVDDSTDTGGDDDLSLPDLSLSLGSSDITGALAMGAAALGLLFLFSEVL